MFQIILTILNRSIYYMNFILSSHQTKLFFLEYKNKFMKRKRNSPNHELYLIVNWFYLILFIINTKYWYEKEYYFTQYYQSMFTNIKMYANLCSAMIYII